MYTCRMCQTEIPKRHKSGSYPKTCSDCKSLKRQCEFCTEEISIWDKAGYPKRRFCNNVCAANGQFKDPYQREIRRDGPSIQGIKRVQGTKAWQEMMRQKSRARMFDLIAKGEHPWSQAYSTGISKVELSVQSILEEYQYWHSSLEFRVRHPDGSLRSPDYKKHGEKLVLEVLGRHWHPQEDEIVIPEWYRGAGYQCIIVWDNQIKDPEDIRRFVDPVNERGR